MRSVQCESSLLRSGPVCCVVGCVVQLAWQLQFDVYARALNIFLPARPFAARFFRVFCLFFFTSLDEDLSRLREDRLRLTSE